MAFACPRRNGATDGTDGMQEHSTTVVGAAALVTGQLQSDDDVRVDGTFEGPISTTRDLVIGPNGEVRGDVSAREIQLEGLVNGNVAALGILEIGPTGQVLGDVRAAGLRIHDGGIFHGAVDIVEEPGLPGLAPGSAIPFDPSGETMVSPPPDDFDPAAITIMRSAPSGAGASLSTRLQAPLDEDDDDAPPEWDSQELLQAERQAAIQSAIEEHERSRPRPGELRERSLQDLFTETGRIPPVESPAEEPPPHSLDQVALEPGSTDGE